MKNNKYLFVGIILIILLSTIFVYQNYFSKEETSTFGDENITNNGLAFGNENAPIKIFEFSSFQCPDCLGLHKNSIDILKKYIEEGKIFYVFKPTDTLYLRTPKEYKNEFEIIEKIFKNKNDLGKISINEAKKNLGESVFFERKKLIDEINYEIDKLKIEVIPTMFINGQKLVGLYSKEDFEKVINRVINNVK